MPSLLDRLGRKEQRGSRPRCVVFTDGPANEVARRLTMLISPFGQVMPDRHAWQPKGWADPAEAKLGETPPFLSPEQREIVSNWWLAVRHPLANTPNWDIVSQATVGGREGLVLVEAKAHDEELKKEEVGKRKPKKPKGGSGPTPSNGEKNHNRIGETIAEASRRVQSSTGLPWALSRDSRYQMSNRFAWAWKLVELGYPVILVYLGFLQAGEMHKEGRPFACHDEWDRLVKTHSHPLFPEDIWNREWTIHGQPFVPLIRSMQVELPRSQ